MTAMSIGRANVPIIERIALHIGSAMIRWARTRGERLRDAQPALAARREYVERTRVASVLVSMRILP